MSMTDDQKLLIEYAYYKDPNGVLYPLFGGTKTLMSWEGAGLPPIDYLSDRGPNQHGRTVRGYRFRERRITIELYNKGCRRSDFWANQNELIDAIRPNRSSTNAKSYLLIISPDNIEREIEARIERGPRGDWIGEGSQVPSDLRERLTFLSGDPFWRDPNQNTETFTISPTGACLPTCLPICLGGSGLINSSVDIAYTGTWQGDQIEIEITGPAVNPLIRNDTNGLEIQLNYTVSTGEKITIIIDPEKSTITNNSGTDLIGTVQDIADFNDFILSTAGDLTSDGTNTITVITSGGDQTQTSIIFKYYTRDITLYGA